MQCEYAMAAFSTGEHVRQLNMTRVVYILECDNCVAGQSCTCLTDVLRVQVNGESAARQTVGPLSCQQSSETASSRQSF